MATDFDAVILDWQKNGQTKVNEKINQLGLMLAKNLSPTMRSRVEYNIEYLQKHPSDYINGVIQRYEAEKVCAMSEVVTTEDDE